MLKIIQKRRSCRKFTEDSINDSLKLKLAKAALWSQTSKNNRPWEFYFITNKEIIEKLSQCKPHGASFISGAALLIMIAADPEKSDVWVEDCAIAASNIQLVAEEENLGSCWVQVRKRMYNETKSAGDFIKELITIPQNLEIASIIAIGKKVKDRTPYTDEQLLWEKIHNLYSTDL